MGQILTPGYIYWDGLKYYTTPNSSTISGSAGGDLHGEYPNPTVVGINGNQVNPDMHLDIDSDGYVLTWTLLHLPDHDPEYYWTAQPTATQFVAGGDLSGTSTSQKVIGLDGYSILPLADGYLNWTGTAWQFSSLPSSLSPSGPAGGDLDGYYPNPGVAKINGNPIQSQTLGSGQSNYALVWNGTTWLAENVFLNQSAGGDLGDFYPNPTVRALWHAAIPEVLPTNPTATSGFAIGNVLQVTNVTANNQALGYGPLNLASNVTGTLSAANQAPQYLQGDVVGYTSQSPYTTVQKIQNIPVQYSSLGLSQDGYVLTYSNASNKWIPLPSTTGASLAGDVSGSITSTNLAKIQGTTVTASSPTSGQVLCYYASAWRPESVNMTLQGDVTGGPSALNPSGYMSTIVGAIQGNAVQSGTLGSAQDGYILTWINNDHEWKPIQNAGGLGAFVAGGDLSGTSVDQTVIKINGTSVPSSPYTGYNNSPVLMATSGTTATWSQITDANVAYNAYIAGSKINTSATGGIYNLVAGNSISAYTIGATYYLGVGTTNITSGSGVPISTPAAGSIYLRTDGTTDGTESIYSYEDGYWVPVGSAAAGAAAGDLSGYYPNPTVIAIQKNQVDGTLLTSPHYDGYVLTWSNNAWVAQQSTVGVVLSGDVTGDITSNIVTKLQGIPVASGTPTTNYILTYNGSEWIAQAAQTSFTAGGDLSGTDTSQTVTGIKGKSLPTLPVSDGYLNYTGSAWQYSTITIPTTLPPNGTASGDLSGTYPGPTVKAIQGVAIAAGGPTTNQVLEYNGSEWIGTSLPTSLPPNGLAGGDLSGSYPSPTVAKIQGNSVASGTLTSTQDGYVLTWNHTSGWEAEPVVTGSTTLSGDVTGTTTSNTVTKIQGNSVASGTLTSIQDGYVLTWNHTSGWEAEPIVTGSTTLSGDVTGTTTSSTVTAIRGITVSATAPTSDQVLTYVSGEWKPQTPSGGGGGGGELGKVIYTSYTTTANYVIDSGQDDYYILCNVSSNAIHITLPASPAVGRTIVIKDISNNAFINNITILQSGSEYIEGAQASFVISSDRGSATLTADGSGNWWIV
jgi:hypothetical protein